MRTAHFYLKLKPEELLEYYQGHKHFVRVRTYEGYSIQFRAEHLRRWVKKQGIHGEFEITFDDHNHFAGLAMYRDLSGASLNSPLNSGGRLGTGGHAASERIEAPPAPGPRQRPRGFNKSI